MNWLRKFIHRLRRRPLPPLGVEGLVKAKQYVNEYETMRAKRVLPKESSLVPPSTMAAYSLQAAGIVEKEGHSRAPSLENEVRLLSLALRSSITQLEDLHAFILMHIR